MELKSHEYEELNKKIVSILRDIDTLSNTVEIYSESIKTNRANIGVLKRREHEEETENTKKDDPIYL